MTTQAAERLIVEHPAIDVQGLRLWAVILGDLQTNEGWGQRYRARVQPTPSSTGGYSTALWRKYVATYRLAADGTLELVSYEYPFSGPPGVHDVGERLEGDFWLVLKSEYSGPRTYVPFRSGRVVVDRAEWITEPEGSFTGPPIWLD